MHASGVNTGDWRIRAAAFPGILAIPGRLMFGILRPRNPRLGTEFAGIVESVGPSASRFSVGDRVFGMIPAGGASAEYITVDEKGAIAAIPSQLSVEEAPAMPFGGLCALVFLGEFADVSPDKKVLIVGASGGVGVYAVQIAKALGAHVTAVAGPDSQNLISELGADCVVNYRETDFDQLGAQFDVVFDAYGSVSPSASRQLLRNGGLFLPLNYGLREIGAALLNRFRDRKIRLAVNEDRMEDMVRLGEMVEKGTLCPVVHKVFPFKDAARAHAQVETRHKRGAVVLSLVDATT